MPDTKREFSFLPDGKGTLNFLKGLVKMTDKGTVTIAGDLEISGRVTYSNRDTAGFAKINPGHQEVEVVFDQPYDHPPVITVTADEAGLKFGMRAQSTTGFMIYLTEPASQEEKFSWSALAIKNARTSESKEAGVSNPVTQPSDPASPIEPTLTPVPETASSSTTSGEVAGDSTSL